MTDSTRRSRLIWGGFALLLVAMATPSSHRRELCSTRPVCSVLIVLLWAESSDALNYSGSNSSMNISGSGGTSISSSGSSTATEKLLAILTCLLDITCVGLILAWKYRQNSNRRTDHSMLFPAKVTCQQEAALDSCNAAPAADGEQIPVPVAPLTGLATQSSVHRLQQANNDTISGENDGLPDIVWGTHVFHGLFDYSGHPTLDRCRRHPPSPPSPPHHQHTTLASIALLSRICT